MTLLDLITIAIVVFVLFNGVLTAVLGVIWAERKTLARLQQRVGPSRTGPSGILQTAADAIKLMLKEDVRPADVNRLIYYAAPLLVFTPIFMLWIVLPFGPDWVLSDLDIGLFYVVAILGLSVVGHVLAGWASNNKYALLGSARNAAQLISYELPLVFAVLAVGVMAQTATDRPFSLAGIVEAQGGVPYLLVMPLGFLLFLIGALAETARIPFDIPHAEEEIVGGAFVEYSGIRWGAFFLTEYAGLATMAFLATILFLGGWNGAVLRSVAVPATLLLAGQNLGDHPAGVLDSSAAPTPPHRPINGIRVEVGYSGLAGQPDGRGDAGVDSASEWLGALADKRDNQCDKHRVGGGSRHIYSAAQATKAQ